MKSLVQFINESKERPMYDEWEIHSYVDYMLRAWFENNKNYASVIAVADVYSRKELVKSCEIAVTLLECLADVVKLHFVSAKEHNNNHVSYSCENAFYKAFKVIEAIISVEFEDEKDELEKTLKTEIKQLKERVDALVKNCNEKYDKWVKELTGEQKSNNSDKCVCVPCDCCGYAC